MSQILDLVLVVKKLVEDCCTTKKGENVLIMGTTETNRDLLDAVMAATLAAEANAVMILAKPWPGGAEPWKPIAEAMKNANLLINFTPPPMLFAQQSVKEALGSGLRIANVSADIDFLKRGLIDVDYNEISALHDSLANVLLNGKTIRVTTDAGTNATMEITGRPIVRGDGIVRERGESQWLPGSQINQAQIEESLNGTLVFDWSLMPTAKKVEKPVKLTMKDGRIAKFEGGEEAEEFKKWMESLDDPRMYWCCHYSFGLNPKYQLTPSREEENERVRGVMFFGFGSQLPAFKGKLGSARAHSDCIMKRPTVYVDGKMILKDNKFLV